MQGTHSSRADRSYFPFVPATGIAIVKNLAKLVLQKISLYRETVVVVTRSRDKLDRPPPPLSQLYREIPVSASYRIFHGATGNEVNEGWTEAALTRRNPRNWICSNGSLDRPRGAGGGRDSLEITTPSRDVSPSRVLSRAPPTSLYASMHPFVFVAVLYTISPYPLQSLDRIIELKFIYPKCFVRIVLERERNAIEIFVRRREIQKAVSRPVSNSTNSSSLPPVRYFLPPHFCTVIR